MADKLAVQQPSCQETARNTGQNKMFENNGELVVQGALEGPGTQRMEVQRENSASGLLSPVTISLLLSGAWESEQSFWFSSGARG